MFIFNGKTIHAYRIVFNALKIIQQKTKKDPVLVLTKALFNLKNSFELKKVRKGAVTFEVPFPVHSKRKQILTALRLIRLSLKGTKKDVSESLANTIIESYEKKGVCFEKKIQTLKRLYSNRVYML